MATEPIRTIPPDDEISLKELILKLQDWVRYLRSKWLIILIAGIIGGALGLAYSIYKKPMYTATLTFALEERSSGGSLGAYAGLASQFGIDLGGGGGTSGVFSGDNIMELMKSRLMVTKALLSGISVNGRKESLADYYIGFNHFRDAWKKSGRVPADLSFPVNVNPDSLSFTKDSLMGNFYQQILDNNLTVDKPNNKLSIVAVTCKSFDEVFAKYFTDALVKNVTVFYVQTRTERSTTSVEVLQNRLDSVRKAFSGALYGTAINTDQNLNPARAVVGVPRIKNQTEVQILGAEYAELVKNLEVAKMGLLQETPLIQIIDKPIIPLKESKLGKLRGGIIGGLICCVLAICVVSVRSLFQKIMAE